MKIEKLCGMIERFLAGEYDPLRFSVEFPHALVVYGDEAERENPRAIELLEWNFPEICVEYERGDDPEPFRKRVAEEYERVKADI